MTERDDTQLPAILPDGVEFTADNKYMQSLADRIVVTDHESPIDVLELGAHVFGSRFDVATYGNALGSLIDDGNQKLKDSKWRIATNCEVGGEQKLWLEPIPEEKVEETKSIVLVDEEERRAAVFAEDFSRNFMSQLSQIDRANIQEAMFRDPKRIKEEIDAIAKTVVSVRDGEFDFPQNSQLLEGTVVQKADLVRDRLKGLLAVSVIDPANRAIRSKFAWGRELNEMILFSGGGEAGRQVVFDALFDLSDVERALVLSQISMTKRYELLMTGLDQVNEREMAGFISNAVYKYSRSGDAEELELIITSIAPRDNLDGFEAGRIIAAIKKHYPVRADYIFDQMIEVAKQADCATDLMSLFASNAETWELSRRIEEDEDLPQYVSKFRRI